jgi:dynein heavy chain
MWKKSISWRKFIKARNYMKKNLFLSDPNFGKTLLKLKNMCSIFLDSSLIDISIMEKLSLFDFAELQVILLFYYTDI